MEIRMAGASAIVAILQGFTRESSWISTPPILHFFALTFPA
jgi:hypothetical protein